MVPLALWIAPPFIIALLGLILVRMLFFPRLGCWLFYLATWAFLVFAMTLAMFLLAAGFLLQHLPKEYLFAGSLVIASILLFLGRTILKLRKQNPFAAVMRWLIRASFLNRVGKVRPLEISTQHPHVLAFSAVFDDAYADDRFGPVDGWGVRACCKRLLSIKKR
jgi:hypothetical protein